MPDASVDGRNSERTRELERDLPTLTRQFGLGKPLKHAFIEHGLMNSNWRLETDTGVFVVKRIVDVPLQQARLTLATPGVLAEVGIPACVPLSANGGESVVETAFGRGYCAFPWIDGDHVEGWQLDVVDATVFGGLIGRLHEAIARAADILGWAAAGEMRAKVGMPETAVQETERFLTLIAALDEPGAFDCGVAQVLWDRKALLAEHGADRPVDERPLGPVGWTHGDLQYRNVLWRGGRIVALLDWDRVAVRPLAEEVVRTAQVQFATLDGRLDLGRVAAFVSGYRQVVELADEDLHDAAARLWWKRMTDFWPLQWHYDKGDDSCDALWESGEALLGWWSANRAVVEEALTGRFGPSRG